MIAIGFDLDHTLLLDNAVERTIALEMLAQLARSRNVAYDAAAAEAAVDQALVTFRNGKIVLETVLEGFFQGLLGPDESNELEAARFRDVVCERAGEFVRALPGCSELLAALDAAGVRYAALSNGWSPLQEEKARLIGFAAPVYVSERIGLRKPAREAFEFLASHLEYPADQVWYVGDDPIVDCGGALACGMTALWLDWEGRPYPDDVAPPSRRIGSLAELTTLVQGQLTGAAKAAE